ncbi:RabGAP/TBC [Durotheca rogersii]|uniref:RabGAP/TBC n=1 Tax=Durotheca rogersii TaxID=419775 RepID=UPI00221FEC19|nr:RabGAP/TBC [Durotheca rogersii]KAI5859324.1 RabGAP/TBC [Durotheca rogersii]
MRSLVDSKTRWQDTLQHSSSLSDLQRAVKENGPNSPCISGCRSVCWKAFLLGQIPGNTDWPPALLESRSTYSDLRDRYLKFINHPEYLTAASSDPLADDADSPWSTLRSDEVLRAEILQDVQRLPDEPFYHQSHIQTLILDVLFIYCKLNPAIGGYRQGMHELLAPIVYVVEQDAIDPVEAASDVSADPGMIVMLDASFIEHDAFALFSRVMNHAKAFYEANETTANTPLSTLSQLPPTPSIIQKSQYIHEVCLFKVDPELSTHLKNIEILPQVFLIRWIRLLFSREFPFHQMLVLWDTLFSVDPSFNLIDLVCTAMIIRIRWDLVDADYTAALQLLLKYPPPQPQYGPHTFIDDAVYLKRHLDTAGGSALILKYTKKAPSPLGFISRPTSSRISASTIQKKLAGSRSPISPPRVKSPPASVEALLQGAAKGVLERGERLGINQAVRDAMVEIRRNVQEARSSMKAGRDLFAEPGPSPTARAFAAMDRRNRRLAAMLDESVSALKSLGTSDLDDKERLQSSLELAAAKIQFVKVHLEDSTVALPEEEETVSSLPSATPPISDGKADTGPLGDAAAAVAPTTANDGPRDPTDAKSSSPSGLPKPSSNPDRTDPTDQPPEMTKATATAAASADKAFPQRPRALIPTRSSIAQSSFSWMLEPDSTSASSVVGSSASPSSALSQQPLIFPPSSVPLTAATAAAGTHAHRKRPSANAKRERTAFLFGEAAVDSGGRAALPEGIFGLEELKRKGVGDAGGP